MICMRCLTTPYLAVGLLCVSALSRQEDFKLSRMRAAFSVIGIKNSANGCHPVAYSVITLGGDTDQCLPMKLYCVKFVILF